MATSPIYNWPEPDNTDLVKNGALAIRTLGNAIDTTMGTMVAKTIVDAKGDLIAGTAADAAARLAVGNNGETLVADSSTSTGLRYQGSTAAGRNAFVGGGFDVWQRGTSFAFSSAVGYSADRWYIYSIPTSTISRQVTGDTTNLPFLQYCMRVQRNSGNTSTSTFEISNTIETINSIPYAGKTVTLSFYARAGANFSATSNALTYGLATGTGTDQRYSTDAGFTGLATPIAGTATLTTTWQRFTSTATLSASATEIATKFSYVPTGTAGANDYYEVTGVQLEVGSVATQFTRTGGTIQGELAACQRYYYRNNSATNNNSFLAPLGNATSTTNWTCVYTLPVTMRTTPNSLDYSGMVYYDGSNAVGISTLTLNQSNQNTPYLFGTASGVLVAFRGYYLFANTSSTAYIGFSAEL